jgi:hypothetical protein
MASREVFLDTNGLIGLLNRADELHGVAAAVWAQMLQARPGRYFGLDLC